jgi:hypothetical protein
MTTSWPRDEGMTWEATKDRLLADVLALITVMIGTSLPCWLPSEPTCPQSRVMSCYNDWCAWLCPSNIHRRLSGCSAATIFCLISIKCVVDRKGGKGAWWMTWSAAGEFGRRSMCRSNRLAILAPLLFFPIVRYKDKLAAFTDMNPPSYQSFASTLRSWWMNVFSGAPKTVNQVRRASSGFFQPDHVGSQIRHLGFEIRHLLT